MNFKIRIQFLVELYFLPDKRLQTILLLENEKHSLEMGLTEEMSILEEQIRDLKLEKAKALEKIQALSEQGSHQALKKLLEESKRDSNLEAKMAEFQEENSKLRKRVHGMLVCKQFSSITRKMPVVQNRVNMAQHILDRTHFLHKQWTFITFCASSDC